MSDKKGIIMQVRRVATRIDVMINDIMDRLDDEIEPLTVSIMGQTGVGKSSLMNALLGTDSPVDPISPGTISLREHEINSESGHKVRFYDLPGLGESQRKDEEYIQRYRNILQKSDVALWAVLADSRSFGYDHDALEKILDMPSHQEQVKLMDKIVFVLTKVDLLTDPHYYAPWTLTRLADNQGIFETHTHMETLIKRKEDYFRNVFLQSFRHLIRCQTYHRGRFPTHLPGLHREEDMIYYNDFLTEEQLDRWCQQYKQHRRVFMRLYDSTRIIPCSSLFRYNLDLLSRIIVEKLEPSSSGRFKWFVEEKPMNRISFAKARKYSNMILFDQIKNKVHDLDILGGEDGN